MLNYEGREEDASTSPEDSNRLDGGELVADNEYLSFNKDAASV